MLIDLPPRTSSNRLMCIDEYIPQCGININLFLRVEYVWCPVSYSFGTREQVDSHFGDIAQFHSGRLGRIQGGRMVSEAKETEPYYHGNRLPRVEG